MTTSKKTKGSNLKKSRTGVRDLKPTKDAKGGVPITGVPITGAPLQPDNLSRPAN